MPKLIASRPSTVARSALKLFLRSIGSLVLLGLLIGASAWLYLHPSQSRISGIVYGQRQGHSLTFEALRPDKTNGLGIILMVSGRWKSSTNLFSSAIVGPLLRRGYTVFPVSHLSQPEATVAEIFEDVSRAVRWIRHNAADYGIDPSRLGITGGSAGGHLSLLLATRGGPGPAHATDPVDRESSAVQAVAIFYPVTDLIDLGSSTENLGDGGPPKSFVEAFRAPQGSGLQWSTIGRALSPLYNLSSNCPPTLIYHGDADTLVPLDQSIRYQERARSLGGEVELVVHQGGAHGWPTMIWDIRAFGAWFDGHLLKY